MSRLNTVAIVLLAGLVAAGCSSSPSIQSTYDYNREINFTNFRTYAFIDDSPMAVSQAQGAVSPMLEGRLMESIRIAMNAKGYSEVSDPEAADMVIAFTVGSREQIKVDSYPASYHAGYYRRGYHYGYGLNYGTETRVRQYTEGQLAVDVFEVASRAPAFHGVASKRISDADRENQQAVLNAITVEALSGFPSAGGTIAPAG